MQLIFHWQECERCHYCWMGFDHPCPECGSDSVHWLDAEDETVDIRASPRD